MIRVGFVGVGRVGGHLAASLLRKGFALSVHDLDRGAARQLEAAGAEWADSPAAAARGSDAVVTCLPSPQIVAAVVAGEDGVFASLAHGTTWIDMSTNDRREIMRLAGLAKERGITTLEAPVTGGIHRAAAGEITVIVAGERVVAERHMPLFEAMGGRVFYVGALGHASALKVITNMLALTHVVACGEALMLAKRSGLDLALAYEVIAASSGTSFVHETEGPVILDGSYDIGFTLDLAMKDLGLALALGDDFGVPLDLAPLVAKRFAEARERYGGASWSPTVVRLLEDDVGEVLRAPGFSATEAEAAR